MNHCKINKSSKPTVSVMPLKKYLDKKTVMQEKQPEHYPVPVDQEVIDNYLWYKNMLEKFEQQKIEAERNTSLRKFVRVFESRKDDNILVYTRIKKALKENDEMLFEMLLKIERNIEELREIVERNKHLEDRI
jgi:hypothetical protein